MLQGRDQALQLRGRGDVLAGNDEGTAGACSNGLHVGGFAARRGVDHDHIVLPLEHGHQGIEYRAVEQLLRVGWVRAGRHDGDIHQAIDPGDHIGYFCPAGKHGRETELVGQAEQFVLAGVAQVGIDQQGAFAQLREDNGQIGGDEAAPFRLAGADDSQGIVAAFGIDPAQHELAAQGAQLLDHRAEGFEGSNDIFANAFVSR